MVVGGLRGFFARPAAAAAAAAAEIGVWKCGQSVAGAINRFIDAEMKTIMIVSSMCFGGGR
jgi:hypothetical protein